MPEWGIVETDNLPQVTEGQDFHESCQDFHADVTGHRKAGVSYYLQIIGNELVPCRILGRVLQFLVLLGVLVAPDSVFYDFGVCHRLTWRLPQRKRRL